MVVDSQQWRCVEAVPAIVFSVDGVGAAREREPARRGWLTTAEGVVGEVDEHRLVIGRDAALSFVLPRNVSLAPLRGRAVRLALVDERSADGPRAQTLQVTDAEGRLLLLARFGKAGQTHGLSGGVSLRAVLSQRPRGPMTFGTDRLQYVVPVGRHVRVGSPDGEFVVHVFLEDTRSYYDLEHLWSGAPRVEWSAAEAARS